MLRQNSDDIPYVTLTGNLWHIIIEYLRTMTKRYQEWTVIKEYDRMTERWIQSLWQSIKLLPTETGMHPY